MRSTKGPSLQVLATGVKELFADPRIFAIHSDALEQIRDGVTMLEKHGQGSVTRLRYEGREEKCCTNV